MNNDQFIFLEILLIFTSSQLASQTHKGCWWQFIKMQLLYLSKKKIKNRLKSHLTVSSNSVLKIARENTSQLNRFQVNIQNLTSWVMFHHPGKSKLESRIKLNDEMHSLQKMCAHAYECKQTFCLENNSFSSICFMDYCFQCIIDINGLKHP